MPYCLKFWVSNIDLYWRNRYKLDCNKQKGIKSNQPSPNFIGLLISFWENGNIGTFENFMKYPPWCKENSSKFSRESAHLFSCKKENWMKFSNCWYDSIPSYLTRSEFSSFIFYYFFYLYIFICYLSIYVLPYGRNLEYSANIKKLMSVDVLIFKW